MLEVNALVKRFGNSAVVEEISFSVAEGEVVGFVGLPVFLTCPVPSP
jgi:ABC-type uncharacterized transport system ATPase subunit